MKEMKTNINIILEDTMKELYLETEKGKFPIDQEEIKKYNLHQGTITPFTNNRIVGNNGDFKRESPTNENEDSLKDTFYEMPDKGLKSDGIDQMQDGFELSTSEIIDISQGVDSEY